MFAGWCRFGPKIGFDGPKINSSKNSILRLTCGNNVTSVAHGAATPPNGLKGGKMGT